MSTNKLYLCIFLHYVFLFSAFTTINPETAQKDLDGEPLKTLRKFRQIGGRDLKYRDMYLKIPVAGMHAVLIKPGKIKVGDDIFLQES